MLAPRSGGVLEIEVNFAGGVAGVLRRPITSVHEVAALWPEGLRGEEDENWSWPDIVRESPDNGGWRQFELIGPPPDFLAQGLMIVRDVFAMRSTPNLLSSGCYIEYLATAPWNRIRDGRRLDERHSRLVPVGSHLLRAAILMSVELGHGGRLGWHSKPSSEIWYKGRLPGLYDLGPDESEGRLAYYELTQETASEFLTRTEDARAS